MLIRVLCVCGCALQEAEGRAGVGGSGALHRTFRSVACACSAWQGGMTCVCDSCVGSHGRRLTSLWERWWITQCLMVHPPRSGRIHNTQHGTSMPEQSTK